MNPQHVASPRPHRKLRSVQVSLLTAVLVVCGIGLASSLAQSAAQEEREFKNTIPEHVPIRVKVKNEQSFKDMKNKNWARELEIEVKNTGSKPIYYLYVIITLPDVLVDGHQLTMRTRYGRKELTFLETPLEARDVPIRPGESVTLKIPESRVRTHETLRDEGKRADPKKVEFEMQRINFGDGTGLRGRDGRPDRGRKQSQNETHSKREGRSCPPAIKVPEIDSSGHYLKTFASSLMPASFLRAKFSILDKASASTATPTAPDLCGCNHEIVGCMWARGARTGRWAWDVFLQKAR